LKKTYNKPNTKLSEDEFRKKFSTETNVRKYLETMIWNGKPKCPFCINPNPANRQKGKIKDKIYNAITLCLSMYFSIFTTDG